MNKENFPLVPYINDYLQSEYHLHYNEESQIFFTEQKTAEHFLVNNQRLFGAFTSHDTDRVKSAARAFARFATTAEIPYIVVHHIVENFRTTLMRRFLDDDQTSSDIRFFLDMVEIAERTIAQFYLAKKVPKFLRHNMLRIRSLHELINKSIMDFYEYHLEWLNQLSEAIVELDHSLLPELKPEACRLGQWLQHEAIGLIADNERHRELIVTHRNLHLIAKRTELLLKNEPIDFHYLMLLLKNADLLSNAIGLELAIINNVEFIKSSSKDPLTGTLNRQLFYSILRNQFDISKALERSFAVIMTDLDDFKQINDRYGHLAGDDVLRQFAALLIEETRKSDFVIRYGGEEFIIILPIATYDDARKIAEKLRRKAAELFVGSEIIDEGITASFGIGAFMPGEQEYPTRELLDGIIAQVDGRLYLAKQQGKNCVI
jgi:diguanylate cyclase